ncbi:hypothetical protein Poly51_42420 [Rubripirellula tenax]|uniref:Transmembrane protein n=1 Tax=Rubripirellula tenax TaxID=2528015 RepID=A0A5C6EU04_9BACT|nr:hypothetical protein [Rubripirellula tenax]TWU50949.1 hypothetical protein Poly51_42420 [Rubripirellula tenax]
MNSPTDPPKADGTPGFNPYVPASDVGAGRIADPAINKTIRELGRWQMFFAIMLGLAVGLTMLMMLIPLLSGGIGDAVGGMLCLGGGSLLLYGLPALMLWKAATIARQCSVEPDVDQMAELMRAQVRFWRTIGIIAGFVLAFYGLALVMALVGTVSMSN